SSTSITGQQGLPLKVAVHGSQGAGGPAGAWGDYYLYFGTREMGYRDGLPGVFTVQENRSKEGNTLQLAARDAIEHPSGRTAFETMWLGYYCIPQGAKHTEPRYYRYTENRLLWMTDWSIKRYSADPQRISMGGSSMGGLGSINVGFRHPELFAAVYPTTAPFLWWPPSSLAKRVSRDEKALMADGKTTYADYTNSPRFAAEHHEDMPFLGWAVGRRDPNHNWQEYIDMVKALTDNHHGFAFSWNDGGHSEGGRALAAVTKYYPATKFARDRSYPAFGHSSLDSNMGNGGKLDGDLIGGINLGFDWKDLADGEDKWSVTLSNELCKDTMTVDVTPRRCQKFSPKPGSQCKWTTSTGQKGTAVVDQWGLVTVPKVVLKANMGTVVTIEAAR
ncbi:MAG: alpha/beta hydrolase-fold protein, partial [Gemmataceae bacterium]